MLSAANLEQEVVVRMNTAFEQRIRELQKNQTKRLATLREQERLEKLRWEKLYI